MSTQTFRALRVTRTDDGQTAQFQDMTRDDLPAGDVLVRVSHSSLNYKDGAAVVGAGKIIREFPMTPGIDLVGTVEESDSDDFSAGDAVICTGSGIGTDHAGGYAQYARLKSEWLVPLPEGMTPVHAMAIGTAGFTAMLAVRALEVRGGLTPDAGDILVTGASGGAGSMAVSILAELGYTVVASTGSEDAADYLRELGASRITGRLSAPERPMDSAEWAGAIDSVGGDTLASVLSKIQYGGSVAAYGVAAGHQLNTTVFPFILRGVNLLGVDSVQCPMDARLDAWQRLAQDLPADKIEQMMRVEPLSNVQALSGAILAGDIRGRVVFNVDE